MDMNVDRAGDRPDLLGDIGRQREIAGHVAADDLNVDGSGKPEIQDLSYDIGRLKGERSVRKMFRQFFAELRDVAGGRVMFRLQGDQDLRVEVADGFAVAVGEIDSAGGQTNVIENAAQLRRRNDPADYVFGLACDSCGLFDASAGGRAEMQAQLAGIDAGKEVLP